MRRTHLPIAQDMRIWLCGEIQALQDRRNTSQYLRNSFSINQNGLANNQLHEL